MSKYTRKFNIKWRRKGESKIHSCNELTETQLVARLINLVYRHGQTVIISELEIE